MRECSFCFAVSLSVMHLFQWTIGHCRAETKVQTDLVSFPAPVPPRSSSSTILSAARPQKTPPTPSVAPSNASTSTNPTKPALSASNTTSPPRQNASSKAATRSSTSGVPSKPSAKIRSESQKLTPCPKRIFCPCSLSIRIGSGRRLP